MSRFSAYLMHHIKQKFLFRQRSNLGSWRPAKNKRKIENLHFLFASGNRRHSPHVKVLDTALGSDQHFVFRAKRGISKHFDNHFSLGRLGHWCSELLHRCGTGMWIGKRMSKLGFFDFLRPSRWGSTPKQSGTGQGQQGLREQSARWFFHDVS